MTSVRSGDTDMTNTDDFIDCALDVVDDSQLERIFDDRVWVSVDKYLWDRFIKAANTEEETYG